MELPHLKVRLWRLVLLLAYVVRGPSYLGEVPIKSFLPSYLLI